MKCSYPTLITLLLFIVTGLSSCNKDKLPEDTLILNHWIWDGMNEIYLWESSIPALDPETEADPESFFYKLLDEDDKYSWIVDDYDALLAMLNGTDLTNGMSLGPACTGESCENDDQVVCLVEFVSPGSPADLAGVRRGDILFQVDGEPLTVSNYTDLIYRESALFGFADHNGTVFVFNGTEIALTAIEFNQDPILYSEIIDLEGISTGYFVYTQFTAGEVGEWLTKLDSLLGAFEAEAVDELIVDLRYNPGGSLWLSSYLASSLAPATVSEAEEIFVDLEWNDLYQSYWQDQDLDEDGEKDGLESWQLRLRMPEPEHNLDLDRVYFLTTRGTASASESLISGLYPYTDVVQIGSNTYGKCYGSVTVPDWEEPRQHNWAMQPIVIKYQNAAGFTDFTSGLEEDIYVKDPIIDARAFGDREDPLLSMALDHIQGINVTGSLKGIPEVGSYRRLPGRPSMVTELSWPVSEGLY